VSFQVTIVDYGMGNLWSIKSALEYLGVPSVIESSPEKIASSERLILPGVGSFARAMHNLNERGLTEALNQAVIDRRRPVLGICLGMQLLANAGSEDGLTNGLGWIPGEVVRLKEAVVGKVPRVGFDNVQFTGENEPLFAGLGGHADFYFVHSYHFLPKKSDVVKGTCDSGISIVAAVGAENIFGVQFHPEKSQSNGLRLLHNFSKA
jgi:glutamine amidotransferase